MSPSNQIWWNKVTLRAGTRGNVAPGAVLEIEATRQESTDGAPATNAIEFQTEMRW